MPALDNMHAFVCAVCAKVEHKIQNTQVQYTPYPVPQYTAIHQTKSG